MSCLPLEIFSLIQLSHVQCIVDCSQETSQILGFSKFLQNIAK